MDVGLSQGRVAPIPPYSWKPKPLAALLSLDPASRSFLSIHKFCLDLPTAPSVWVAAGGSSLASPPSPHWPSKGPG